MKAVVLAALAVAALAGPSLAQDRHDEHHPAMVMHHPMMRHHMMRMHEVCLVRHGHRVCHMVRR